MMQHREKFLRGEFVSPATAADTPDAAPASSPVPVVCEVFHLLCTHY